MNSDCTSVPTVVVGIGQVTQRTATKLVAHACHLAGTIIAVAHHYAVGQGHHRSPIDVVIPNLIAYRLQYAEPPGIQSSASL